MTGSGRISTAILAAVCFAFCAPAVKAGAVSPLPITDYSVGPACAAPAPGHDACLAELLHPRTAAARSHTHPIGMTSAHPIDTQSAAEGVDGLRPQDLRAAYFPGEAPDAPATEPQMIAIVDAYYDPQAEGDLQVYDKEFSLPACTTAGGCFTQVNQNGETGNPPFPASADAKREKEELCESTKAEPAVKKAACRAIEEADGWSLETALDIEMAHAICQNCRIVLVEADDAEETSLETAEDTAVSLGAGEVSNSWGGTEPAADSEAFNHPGVVVAFATGDDGYLNWGRTKLQEELYGESAGVNYPASSPHVIAVGATSLELNSSDGSFREEKTWIGSAGGCSLNFKAAPWQSEVTDWSSVGCEGRRASADISADGNPYTAPAVYDSVPYIPLGGGLKSAETLNWSPIGGTSASTPMIAAMFALAGGAHGVAYPAKTLYSHLASAALHDITEGANGKCYGDYSGGCTGSMSPLSLTDCGQGVLICNDAAGYDGPSGVGTPNGVDAFEPIHQPQHGAGSPEAPLTETCAGSVFASSGEICGTLNPHSSAKAGYYFAYDKGVLCTGGKRTPLQGETQGQALPVRAELYGLEADTQYSVCLIATDPSGESEGQAVTFTTEPATPKPPQTTAATEVTADSATLNGTLGPQEIATSWYFEYSPDEGCSGAKSTPEVSDTTPSEPEQVSVPVTDLKPGTHYTACLLAKNRIGSSVGATIWFDTEPRAPSIESVSASSTGTEATFEAHISPNAQSARCEFLYGTSETYGSKVSCKETMTGKSQLESVHVTGLEAGSTYYFQVVAENKAGRSLPSEGKGTVTTQTVTPRLTSESATVLSATAAQLTGSLEPRMASTRYHFEYWLEGGHVQSTPAGEIPGGLGEIQLAPQTISDLEPASTYHYRLRAANAWSEVAGEVKTFSTPGGIPEELWLIVLSRQSTQIPATGQHPASPPGAGKPASAKQTSSSKLARALAACRHKWRARPRKRASCMAQARRKYGTHKTKRGKKRR